jgi:hypothetical protein
MGTVENQTVSVYHVQTSPANSISELAALTGMGERNQQSLYPGREIHGSIRSNSRALNHPTRPYDPNEDDLLDHAMSIKSSATDAQSHYIVAPSIQVRCEFPSITRTSDPSQPLTCIVVVELPAKRLAGSTPGPIISDPYPVAPSPVSRQASRSSPPTPHEYASPSSYQNDTPVNVQEEHQQNFVDPFPAPDEESPFAAITEDLRNRIIDWKGHPLSGLGPLQMYDLLSVRRDTIVRDFFVYLFQEAIICVVEEKKRGLSRLLGESNAATGGNPGQHKGVLRLKGRIYIRHIKHVSDTSVSHEMSLTIDMEDERLDSFILIFHERSSLETWKTRIQNLVTLFQQQSGLFPTTQQVADSGPNLEEFGGSNKAARMLSGSTGTASTLDSLLGGSHRSTMSSNTSHNSTNLSALKAQHNKLATLDEDGQTTRYHTPVPLVTPHTSAGPSNSLAPLPHPPIDIILVISVPPPHATPSTASLKKRLIKTSLDFVIGSLSPKDRLSLVTFEVGSGGKVRKTPFLSIGKPQSQARLIKFVDEIGMNAEDPAYEDEFLVRGSQEEKTDVVTAVNHSEWQPSFHFILIYV